MQSCNMSQSSSSHIVMKNLQDDEGTDHGEVSDAPPPLPKLDSQRSIPVLPPPPSPPPPQSFTVPTSSVMSESPSPSPPPPQSFTVPTSSVMLESPLLSSMQPPASVLASSVPSDKSNKIPTEDLQPLSTPVNKLSAPSPPPPPPSPAIPSPPRPPPSPMKKTNATNTSPPPEPPLPDLTSKQSDSTSVAVPHMLLQTSYSVSVVASQSSSTQSVPPPPNLTMSPVNSVSSGIKGRSLTEIDMSELESLFSAQLPNSDSSKRRSSIGGRSDKVHLIAIRRANNCEIMLTKVKVPIPDLM
ncbi:hypothetical protein B296_00052136, partial [Ensete ventricosum]